MRKPAGDGRVLGCLGKYGLGHKFWGRKWEVMDNVMFRNFSGQIIHFPKASPPNPILREKIT